LDAQGDAPHWRLEKRDSTTYRLLGPWAAYPLPAARAAVEAAIDLVGTDAVRRIVDEVDG
jgi:hypothetical protein